MNETKSNKGLIIFLVLLVLVLAALVVLLATETISFKSILNKEETTKVEKDTKQKEEIINEIAEVKEPIKEKEDEPVATTNNKKQKSSVETSKILEYYKDRVAVCATDSSNTEYKYALVDINDDDIPELIIYTGGFLGSTIIGDLSIYSYDENTGNSSSHYVIQVGTIHGRLGLNTTLYKMNDGTLLSVYGHSGYEETASYKLENDWLVRIKFTSVESDNYTKGDKEITFAECSDTSLFDNYK